MRLFRCRESALWTHAHIAFVSRPTLRLNSGRLKRTRGVSMKLFFSVGEPSGDLHGANLIRQLRAISPEIRCVGFGGPRMRNAGCELHVDLTQKSVMWLSRVVSQLTYFFGLLRQADSYFAESPPDAVVLIDYPGFNWWIARKAKARGICVIYYGTPQLWAWAPWRVRKMRRLVDHALCKLPFEQEWFRARGVNATYVGHPYFDELSMRQLDQQFLDRISGRDGQSVTILPGSRDQEVQQNLPWLLKAATHVKRRLPSTRFYLASFNDRQATHARELIASCDFSAEVHVGRTAELIQAADSCMACSGSVSLELLYHEKPSVVLYWVNRFAFALQKIFRTAKHITLTNLLADHHQLPPPVPEHLTCRDASGELGAQVVRWLEDEGEYERNRALLSALRAEDAVPGASRRAAEYIMRCIGSGQNQRTQPDNKTLRDVA